MAQPDVDWAGISFDYFESVVQLLDSADLRAVTSTCRNWRKHVHSALRDLRPVSVQLGRLHNFTRLECIHFPTGDPSSVSPLTRRHSGSPLQGADRRCLVREVAAELRNLDSLRELTAPITSVDDAVAVASIGSLRRLDSSGSKDICNRGVAAIAKLGNLQSLSLEACPEISDEGVAHLSALTNLHELFLGQPRVSSSTSFTDLAALEPETPTSKLSHAAPALLPTLTSLRRLSLHNCAAVTDKGMQSLAQLTSLEFLTLVYSGEQPIWGQFFTAGGIAQLHTLHSLRELTVEGCNWCLDKQQLGELSSLARLQLLDVSQRGRRLGHFDGGLLAYLPMRTLRVFRAAKTLLSGEVLHHLARAQALRELDLSNCPRIHSRPLTMLSRLTHLEWLAMDDSRLLTPDQPPSWGWLGGLTCLTYLSCREGCENASISADFITREVRHGLLFDSKLPAPRILGQLPQLVRMRSLCLAMHVLGPTTTALAGIAPLTCLTALDLSGCGASSARAFNQELAWVGGLRGLQSLCLAGTKIDYTGLQNLKGLQDLRRLDLQLTMMGTLELFTLTAFPSLQTLLLSGEPEGRSTVSGPIRDPELACLSRLRGLVDLRMNWNCSISVAGLQSLSVLQGLTRLEALGCIFPNISGALHALSGCTSLAVLRLGRPRHMRALLRDSSDDTALTYIANVLVAQAPCVSQRDVAALHAALPYLRKLQLGTVVVSGRLQYALRSGSYALLRALAMTFLALVHICHRPFSSKSSPVVA